MPAARFTNVPQSGFSSSWSSTSRQYAPYAAKGKFTNLTEKERQARKLRTSNMSGAGNYGGPVPIGAGSNTSLSGNSSFFSPQLSTDFLELPQSLREKREIYRHFYNTDPIVGQAIDLHTELPLSKVRLSTPKPRTCPQGFKSADNYGKYILDFFERMCDKIELFKRLITGTHHYWLDGNVFLFAEDSSVDIPVEVGNRVERRPLAILNPDGTGTETEQELVEPYPDHEEKDLAYYQKNYKGWAKLVILPIDQVKLTTFSFTDKTRIELIPSDRDKALFTQAKAGDERAQEMVEEIPSEVRDYLESGKLIPLGTDADEGSFCYHLAARRGAGEDLGASILDRCLRCHLPGTLVLVQRNGLIGQIPIETLNPDTDLLLSHTGVWRGFEIGVRVVDEEVSLLHVSKLYSPIACTKNHKHFVLRDGKVVDLLAGDIRPRDALQVPQIPLTESVSRFDLSLDFDNTSSPRWLDLNSDFGYFVGYWLGAGHLAKREGLAYGCLGITFDNTQTTSVLSIEGQIKPTLDRLGVTWQTNGSHLFGYQDTLIRWLAKNFGHTCEDKQLPNWIFDAPKDFLLGLLRGFVDSDGDVVTKKDGSISVRFNGSNKSLTDQIFLLCTSLGIPASNTNALKERWVKQLSCAKPSYSVHFTHGPSVKKFFESGFLAKKKVPDSWKTGKSGPRHIEFEGKLYYRVTRVGTTTYTGPVYSLNVHEDHTFFANLAATRNCLYYREKLRQAQTLIASRAMTPKRLIWGEGLSELDVEDLREQVDLALVDPDYSIITNYEVHWEDIGARDRLLDLSTEYEITDKQLFAGLGVTESLLNGEATFSGDRVKLEVLNTRYLLFREMIQEYVEKYLFRPVARRKGFVEQDEWGNEVVLYPRLSFTRLALRDSQDTYDALFNLYQKGSVSVDVILELFNIDPQDTKEKLERDMFTINDSTFNEVLRGIYGEVGRKLVEDTNVSEKIAEYLHLKKNAAPSQESESRFG